MMNIGQAAAATGISAKMIRHYESIALIQDSKRSASGYRIYSQRDLHNLHFIRSARSLGFSLAQIKQLLSLWVDQQRASADVKALVEVHVSELDQKIVELKAMRDQLQCLADSCSGDARPYCPILEGLEHPLASGHI